MNDSRRGESPRRLHHGSSGGSLLQLLGLSEAVMLGGRSRSPHLHPLACRYPNTTRTFFPCPSPPAHLDHPEQGKPPRTVMVHSTLTCHELAERSVQMLPFHSALVQRPLRTLPAHAGLNLPPVSCQMRSWRAYSPVGLCQHCAFSSRPLLPLRCLPCCIYSFLIRLNKPKDSCLLFSRGFGSGGKPP